MSLCHTLSVAIIHDQRRSKASLAEGRPTPIFTDGKYVSFGIGYLATASRRRRSTGLLVPNKRARVRRLRCKGLVDDEFLIWIDHGRGLPPQPLCE